MLILETDIQEVYDLFRNERNAFFVKLQDLYNKACLEYWGEDISIFSYSNGNIKQFLAINTALENINIQEYRLRSFRGMWDLANRIKKGDWIDEDEEITEFDSSYAILCIDTYNDIIQKLLDAHDAIHYKIEKLKLEIDKEEAEDIKIPPSKTIEEAENKQLQRLYNQEKKEQENLLKCPECNAPLRLRRNRKTGKPFWGCSNFTKTGCRGSRDYIPKEKKRAKENKRNRPEDAVWFIAREREPDAIARFVQNLGLPRAFIEKLNTEDIEKIREFESVSHWRFDFKSCEDIKIAPEVRFTASLAYKLLTRGTLTMISPRINRFLHREYQMTEDFNPQKFLRYTDKSGKIRYWLDGKYMENYFYRSLLPEAFGSYFDKYFIPQVDLGTLLNLNTEEDLGNQRVDFAINDGINRMVIELDDPSHSEHEEYDRYRDELLDDAGYFVYRIPYSEIKEGSPLIKEIFDKIYRHEDTDLNKEICISDRGFIAGKIIQQVEVITVYGLLNGMFTESDSIAINFSTSVFSREERIKICEELTKDINEFLLMISELYSLNTDFYIEYKDLESPFSENPQKEISYDVSKRATEQRVVVSDFAYNGKFVNKLLQFEAIGKYSFNPEVLKYFLKYLFDKDDFRDGQYIAASNALGKIDSIVLLPTGAGKSIAFQLASLLTPGITMVISPLVSLMEDQVDNLRMYGIDRVRAFTGNLTKREKRDISNLLIVHGDSQITYISPERMQIKSFRETLRNTLVDVPIPLFIIDEAHCLSEWGHDFRTSYLNLGRIIREYCKYDGIPPTILALTGTASDNVLKDMQNQLSIWDNDAIIRPSDGFAREELHYQIIKTDDSKRPENLLKVLNSLPYRFNVSKEDFYSLRGQETYSGIVFCLKIDGKQGLTDVANRLRQESYEIDIYSGRKPKNWKIPQREISSWDKYKSLSSKKFKDNKFNILVATKAYGMGIDKPNIRFTIHYNVPQSIESYYQESGRAGRDRKDSECILLAALNEDIETLNFFREGNYRGVEKEESDVKKILSKLDLENKGTKPYTFRGIIDDKNQDDEEKYIEKAIYRLVLIGVIEDYTNIRGFEYEISIADFTRESIQLAFEKSVADYHKGRLLSQKALVDKINVEEESDVTFILKMARLMITFIYDNVVRGRDEAQENMIELVEKAQFAENQDEFISEYIENYLITKDQAQIEVIVDGENGGIEATVQFFKEGNYSDDRALKGQITRRLESIPDHPGLIFSRIYLDLIDKNDYSNQHALNDISELILNSMERYSIKLSDLKESFLWLINTVRKINSEKIAVEICRKITNLYSVEDRLDLIDVATEDDFIKAPYVFEYMNLIANEVLKSIGEANE